jgi:hypothetical protein
MEEMRKLMKEENYEQNKKLNRIFD